MTTISAIFEILGLASMGVILVRNFTYRLMIKPFTCEMCMTFWAAVIYYHSIEGVLYAFLAAFVAILLNKLV